VEDVNTMNYKGKIKTRFTKTGMVVGNSGDVKKAVVTLSDGDVIDHYSNI
jgi:large subunit ribosomal protein L23